MQKTALNLIQQQIIQRTERCMALACEHFNRQFLMPTIKFNQRGKIAGSARLQLNELRFNPVLMQDNLEHFLSDVVPHEICHLLAFQLRRHNKVVRKVQQYRCIKCGNQLVAA